jgi:HEAT repeat protein
MIRDLSADFFVENPDPKIVEPIIKALEQEKEDQIRIKLSEALKRTNDMRTLDTFIAILNNPKESYEVRYNAGEGLKELKNDKALESLIIALDDKDVGL